jgi:hypothetical protein
MTLTNKLNRIFIILFCFCSTFVKAQEDEYINWELVNSEDEIEVYTRTTASSSVKQIRIVCLVKSSMETITNFMLKASLYSSWVYKCDSSRLIEKVNNNEFSYYITLDFPFPFDDRDLYVKSTNFIDPTTGIYYARSLKGEPESTQNDEYVHISEFESSWKISPLGNGNLQIEYKVLSNPGGEIPTWLVNLAITKGPTETMKQLIKMVEKE